jgi:hypothetical protein
MNFYLSRAHIAVKDKQVKMKEVNFCPLGTTNISLTLMADIATLNYPFQRGQQGNISEIKKGT